MRRIQCHDVFFFFKNVKTTCSGCRIDFDFFYTDKLLSLKLGKRRNLNKVFWLIFYFKKSCTEMLPLVGESLFLRSGQQQYKNINFSLKVIQGRSFQFPYYFLGWDRLLMSWFAEQLGTHRGKLKHLDKMNKKQVKYNNHISLCPSVEKAWKWLFKWK